MDPQREAFAQWFREELKQFDAYRQSLRELISGRPWYQRFFFRWILAID